MNESLVDSDSKYRKYVQQMEKVLQSFETTNEWADLISFLSRVHKTISTFQQYRVIPCKLLLGKRLSQCLNPALPTGVHIKALEVYDCIFEALGAEKLPGNFFQIAFGLLPFFEHCATSTKPNFLDIFERHIVPISMYLEPCLPALLCSLLPGLDENSSEHFDMVFGMIRRIEANFSSDVFLESLVAVFFSSSTQRGNVLTFMSQRSTQEGPGLFDLSIPKDKALFLSFISVGVEDSNLIVIRGCMDVVMSKITLNYNSTESSQFHNEVIQTMLLVLTRKDMSLSRRFLNWIGVESRKDFQFVIDALKTIVQRSKTDEERMFQLFKILTCILDNSKISENVLPELVWDMIRITKEHDTRDDGSVLKVANQFFELADLTIIWSRLLSEAEKSQSIETIETLSFALQNLKITEQSIIATSIVPIATLLVKRFLSYSVDVKSHICRLLQVINRAIIKLDTTYDRSVFYQELASHLGSEYKDRSQAFGLVIDTLSVLSLDSKIDCSVLKTYFECVVKDIEEHTFCSPNNLDCLKKVGFTDNYLSNDQKRAMVADSVVRSIDGDICISDELWIWLYTLDPTSADLVLTEQIDVCISQNDPSRLAALVNLFRRLWTLIGTSGYHRGLGVSLTAIINLNGYKLDRIRAVSIDYFAVSNNRYDRMLDTLMFMTFSSLMRLDPKGHQKAPESMQKTMNAMSIVILKLNGSEYVLPVDMMVLLQDYLTGLNFDTIDIENKVGIVTIIGLFFELISERSDVFVQQSLCEMLRTICFSVALEDRSFMSLIQLHKDVIERTPNMIGYILPSLNCLLQRSSKELARSNQELILITITTLVNALCFLETSYWLNAWECVKTALDCTAFQKDIVLQVWSEGLQMSGKVVEGSVPAFLISIVEYLTRGAFAKSEGRDRSALNVQGGCLVEIMSSLARSISKDSKLIVSLNQLMQHIFKNNCVAFTSAMIELEHLGVVLDPSTDVEYVNCLGAIPEYDMFNQLFKAYRQFRNENAKLVIIVSLLEYLSIRSLPAVDHEKLLLIIRDYLSSATKLRPLLPFLIRWTTKLEAENLIYGEENEHVRRLWESAAFVAQKSQDLLNNLSEPISAVEAENSSLFEKDRTPIRLLLCLRDVVAVRLSSFKEKSRQCVSNSLFAPVIVPSLLQRQSSIAFHIAIRLLQQLRPSDIQPTDEKYTVSTFLESDVMWSSEVVRISIFPFLQAAIKKDGNELVKELLDRSTTGITSNLFTSRETEVQLKIQILRRLSMAALCVSPLTLQTFWPLIQERIVELLKSCSGISSMHVFIFMRCCLFGLSDNAITSLVALLHPTIMEGLSMAAEVGELGEDSLYQLTGIFCFLDCIFLLHRHIAVAYLWGICSPSTTEGILKDIADKHQLSKPESLPAADSHRFILPTSKPGDVGGFAGFLHGLHHRLVQFGQSDQLTRADIERLTLKAVQEMP